MHTDMPLVSVLVPAYNPDYLAQALDSAVEQTYGNLQVVVVSDRPGSDVMEIARRVGDVRVEVHSNEQNLGSVATYQRCFAIARGEYVKFLNDDDLLHPDCIRRMVDAFEEHGSDVTLVTSRRRVIDSEGAPLPAHKATLSPFRGDALVDGRDLADFILRTLNNIIGEPSTAMFRRRDLGADGRSIFRFGDRDHTMNVDVVMWMQLMARGHVVYLADELSSLRKHAAQEQQDPRNALSLRIAWQAIIEDARSSGMLVDDDHWREARLRCLFLFERSLAAGVLEPTESAVLRRRADELRRELGHVHPWSRPRRVSSMIRAVARRPGWRPPVRHRYL
jgi:glycosyltransferase involved in cell wall biosynthesis